MEMNGQCKWKYKNIYIIKKKLGNEMGGVHVGGGKGEESSIKKERGIWAIVEERGGGGLVVVVLGGAA